MSDTLHDRITALLDDPSAQDVTGTWVDRKRLADLLAETATTQPETDAVERAARGWHEAAEREAQDEGGAGMGPWESIDTDSRARALRYMRAALAAAGGGCACPWHEDGDESGGYGVYEQAHTSDCAAAAQPVEPEPDERDTEWTVRHPDGRPISGAQVLPDRTWIDDFALARWPGAIVVRREVSAWTTVADTPTQAGGDA